jgi:hypothetical protein
MKRVLLSSLILLFPLLSGQMAITRRGASKNFCTEMSADDFSSDTIGTTWQAGQNASLHPLDCKWSIESGLLKFTVLDETACEPSLPFTLGRSEASTTVDQYACIVWDSNVGAAPLRLIFRLDTQTQTTDTYYQFLASAASTTRTLRKPDGNNSTTCTNGASFEAGDQFCASVIGIGTATVLRAWVSNSGSHQTGDPDTWRVSDCCWTEDGGSGCLDYGTYTGATVKDTGSYQGVRVSSSTDFTLNDYVAMDTWVAGSCN